MEQITKIEIENGQKDAGASLAIARPTPGVRRLIPSFDAGIFGLLVTLVAMSVFFSFQSPYFLNLDNFFNIGRAVAIRGILAVGLTMVMISGGIDLSIASVMAAAGMLTAVLLQRGISDSLVILTAIGSGVVLGALNGFFITRLRINPIIATLGTMSIIRGIGYVFSDGIAISVGANSFKYLGRGEFLGIPVPLVLWALICLLAFLTLRYTILGQYTYAIGGNANACRLSGVAVDRWRVLLYIVSGALAAFGGVILTSLSGTATPTAGIGAELDIIAAVILGGISLAGGRGGIVGTVLGMLILGTMSNGMTLMDVKPYWQIVLRGAVLMIAVAVDSVRTGGYR